MWNGLPEEWDSSWLDEFSFEEVTEGHGWCMAFDRRKGRLPVKKGFKKQGQKQAGGVQGTPRVVRRSTAKKHGRCTFDRHFTVFKVFCILFKLFTLPLS